MKTLILLWKLPLLPITLAVAMWSLSANALLTPEALIDAANTSNPSIESLQARHQRDNYIAQTKGRLSEPELFVGILPNSFSSSMGTRGVLQVSQKLPWLGKLSLERDIANSAVEASTYDVELALRELRYTAEYYWAEWWYIHQALASNRMTESLYQQLLKTASTKYENGAGSQQDFLSAQTQLMHIQHYAIVLGEQRAMIKSDINTLQHRDSNTAVESPAGLPSAFTVDSVANLRRSLDSHPAIKTLGAKSDAAGAKRQLASRNRFPDLVAQAAYFSNRDPNDKRLQLGVGFEIPFDQSRRQANIHATEYQQKAVQRDLAHTRATLEGEITKALSRIRQRQHIVHLYSQRLESLATKNRSAALNDYTSGQNDFSAIAEATRLTFDVSLTLARARADLFIAYAELTKIVGDQADAVGEPS
ncbi:MAG: cobalt-zinc-cadmium efflux system outer membrane protein [Gammaproteobacteria bacterium]